MAINPYTRPADLKLMNTYVPIPFEAMMAAGTAGQKRLEELDQMYNSVDTALGQVQGLGYIPSLHAGKPGTEVKAKKLVDERAGYYRDRMNQILKENPNLLGMAPRMQLMGLLNELKKDVGPSGVFGIQKQNVETFNNYQKMLQENKDWKTNRWTASQIQQAWDKWAEATNSGKNVLMDSYAGFTNSIDPYEEIQKRSLDKLKGTLLQNWSGPKPTGVEGWQRVFKLNGLSDEQIKNAIDTSIAQDSEINNVIAMQAAWEAEETGKDYKEIYKDKVNKMHAAAYSTYFSPQVVEKWLKEGKGKGHHTDPNDLISANIVAALNSPLKDYDAKDMFTEMKLVQTSIMEEQANYNSWLKKNGIENPGTPIATTGPNKGKDLSREVNAYKTSIDRLRGRQKQLLDAHVAALSESGLSEDKFQEMIAEFYGKKYVDKNLVEAEGNALKEAMPQGSFWNKHNWNTAYLIQREWRKGLKTGKYKYIGDELVDAKTEEPITVINYGKSDISDLTKEEFKRYNKKLEENLKKSSTTVPITELDPFMKKKDLINDLKLVAGSFESASERLNDVRTGNYIDKKTWKNLDLKTSEVKGWWINPNNGQIELVYYVEDKDGNAYNLSMTPPINFESYLTVNNYMDDVETATTKQLYDMYNNPLYLYRSNSRVELGKDFDKTDYDFYASQGYDTKGMKAPITVANVRKIRPDGVNEVIPSWEVDLNFNGKTKTERVSTLAEVISLIAFKRRTDLEEWKKGLKKIK